jgi:hypothetical protein
VRPYALENQLNCCEVRNVDDDDVLNNSVRCFVSCQVGWGCSREMIGIRTLIRAMVTAKLSLVSVEFFL